MAQRTVALYENEYIGIETIYKINNLGERINIPEKLAYVRTLSQAGKLFCPCGCGANLVLVAGEKMLREQHFRIKDGEEKSECSYVAEGQISIRSKIDLKYWLESRIGISDIQTRFQLKNILGSNDRKFELSFFSRDKKLAICYWKSFDIGVEEKFKNVKSLSEYINIFYIVDESNSGTNGQYPEMMMKIQEVQGLCLFMNCTNDNYKDTILRAAFFTQNARGQWVEITVAGNTLDNWNINENNELIVGGSLLKKIFSYRKSKYEKEFKLEKERLEEENRAKAEALRLLNEKLEKQEQERKSYELQQSQLRRQAIEEQRKQEQENKQMLALFNTANYGGLFDQQDTRVRINGVRYVMCETCGKVKKEDDFSSYGGPNHVNLGTCSVCMRAGRKK